MLNLKRIRSLISPLLQKAVLVCPHLNKWSKTKNLTWSVRVCFPQKHQKSVTVIRRVIHQNKAK